MFRIFKKKKKKAVIITKPNTLIVQIRKEIPKLAEARDSCFWFVGFPRFLGFPGGSAVKNLHAMQETQVQSLSQEDPLEKGMATHSSILACRIPWCATIHGVTESDTTE